MTKLFLIIYFPIMLMSSCQTSSKKELKKPSNTTQMLATGNQSLPEAPPPTLDSVLDIKIEGHWVMILSPQTKEIKGNILVLPGWNFPRKDWCEKSSLCQKALSRGYRLVMPEMSKSVYSTKLYPETRSDWRSFPTKTWLVEKMIPYLQDSLQVMTEKQANFVLGLSTGARGVALVALAKPTLFRAGAALSGDYEQTQMPQDNLMIGFYGSYAQFKERWEREDNPAKQVKYFETPLYLGHGKQDKVVPVAQTQIFYDALRKAKPELRVKLHLTNAGHDYAYWDSEVENMLDFFESE
jgi:predicted esterase